METSHKKSVGDHIKQVAAYGILITFLSLGLGVGATYWSSTVASLNLQLSQSRTELNKATDELSQVKSEYLTYRISHEDKSRVTKSKPSVADSVTQKSMDGVVSDIEKKKIDVGSSAQFFNDDLTISLISSSYQGDPLQGESLRYLVTANVSSANGKVEKMVGREIGGVLNYVGDKNYRVVILEAGTFSATFRVSVQK